MAKQKRRILEKIKLTEISGVDTPCQEGAMVTIMKRREKETATMVNPELEGHVLDLEAKLDHLAKQKPPPFHERVAAIQSRDNCSGTQALAKARREHPQAFEQYNTRPESGTFEQLVKAEIAGSCMTRCVAEQRVIEKYGPRPEDLRKSAAVTDFTKLVDDLVAEHGCSTTMAMAEVRKRRPDLYRQIQEV